MPTLHEPDPRTRPGRGQPHDLLVSRVPALKRVGHKGADHVAPGNTRESFEAALEHGVDMIEFDVLRLRDGRLVLAHDYRDAAKRTPLTLDEGLDLFAGEAYSGVELDVDLKLPGYEREVLEGLRGARASGALARSRANTSRASTGCASSSRTSAAAGRCRAPSATTPAACGRCPPTASSR